MSKEVDNIFGKIALILVFGSALLHGWLSVLQYMVHQEDILLPVDCILFVAAAAAVILSILTSKRQVRIRIGHAMTAFLLVALLISCVPAIVIGLPFDDWLDEHLYNYPTVALMLIIYGVLFLLIEKRNKKVKPIIRSIDQIDYVTALLIGMFQVLALIPGTSRSGATILGGIILGMSRKTASEYTFFLAIPVMLGASLLKLVKFGLIFSGFELFLLIVGMLVAFFVSIFAIKFLLKYIRNHDFTVFGYYRIILGVIVLIYFAVTTLLA